MKKIFALLAIAFAAMQITAANVDLTSAQSTAQRFLQSRTVNGRLMTSTPTVKWTHAEKNSTNAALAVYYIVNTDKGYVIVSGDDRARQVLAYGEGSIENLNDLPEAMQVFLNMYKAEMEYLQAHPGLKVQNRLTSSGVSIEPMLTTSWSQDKPYNMKTPKKGYGSNPYCKVGCSAVALAQVMNYWEYPETSPALPGYTCPTSGYVIDALPEYTFDWANMLDYYKSSTDQYSDAELDAIGWLMRYVGQAETMDYGLDQSGAERDQILDALRTFGYDDDARIVMKWDFDDGTVNYTEEEWAQLIQSELLAGRPLIYCAFDMSTDSTAIGGHAFNVDGYDAENDLYHVNFGMAADKNTYYALDAFTIDGGMTVYDFYPILFAGVQPAGMSTNPSISVTPNELSMECYTGKTTTATFNVAGSNLTGDITVALTDSNNVFAIDATTVSVDEATGKTITVTYAPQAVGTHSATITLTSDGAVEKVVTLKGVATNEPLVVYDPVMLAADSAYINLTSFRADWTDQTAAENVASYTLEVSEKPASGGVLADVDWSEASGNAEDYLPEGWTVGDYSIFFDEGGIAITTDSYIKTNTLDLSGCEKVTVVIRAKNYYGWTASGLTVSTSVDSKSYELTSDYADYTVVLSCNESDQVTFYADSWNPIIQSIKIYSGEVTAPTLKAAETGDTTYRLITGITDKFYTVNDLAEAGTFTYKVKALYTDGTESAWSNKQMVTLFENTPAHNYEVGDVNHDGQVSIQDVTEIIDYLLGTENGICTICADVDGNESVTINDVTALIDILLGNN